MKFALGLTLVAALAAATSHASAATFLVDDFESYANGQVIADGGNSVPWRRFGAVEDQFVATSGSSLDPTGVRGGTIPIGIPDAGSAATVQRHYTTPQDFSSYATATVLSRSVPEGSSATTNANLGIQLAISDATTTYLSNVIQPEALAAKTFTFAIDDASLFLADGGDSLATVLASTSYIGFRATRIDGTIFTVESLNFDDFALQTAAAVPEPTTLGAIAAAGLLGARRRRR